ncbi:MULTISPECIES: sigma factor G inhibitor Gin [Aeribacillus]|uniref:sigma factor G inhibitor Gin n=1 Tax=Aeribacillus TaxID=1055323 RepID=UPI002E1DF0F4|nr:sigma factor G inhibitor Gin [Aeribacillus composti]
MTYSQQSEIIGETCVICDKQKEKGIHLYSSFICTDCEKDMVQTDTSDWKYQYFVEQLKKAAASKIYS